MSLRQTRYGSHGLFQAICRTNRLDSVDKEYGLIIDYKNLFQKMAKAIAVYNPDTKSKAGQKAKQITLKLIEQKRANYVAAADYTEKSNLFKIIQLCIDEIAAKTELNKYN